MENNSIIGSIPWPVAAATAIWFGVMAYKAGKNWVVWAIGGGMLGLVVTTLVMGLAQATFIPFHTDEVAPFRMKVAGLAILLVFWRGVAVHRKPAPPPADVVESEPKTAGPGRRRPNRPHPPPSRSLAGPACLKISVIIPAFNEERLIGETLRQVKAAMPAFSRRGWASRDHRL